MQGVVFLGERALELREFPDPAPGPGEVVLEIKASGMCGSDLHPYRAPRGGGAAASLGLGGSAGPVIAGHEPCGVVAAVGAGVPESAAVVGQRVMNHHYKGCQRCRHCRTGWSQLCRGGITVYGITGNGAHARYMKAPAATCVPLPDEMSFAEGAAVSCGTGTAYQALKRIGVSGRDTLVVFGQGPVGLSATLLGAAMGARVIAVDLSPERRKLAQNFGAAETIDPKAGDVVAAVHALTGGQGAECTMDCTGNAEARVAALRCADTWGRVALVGEGGQTTFDVSQQMLRRQLTIHASWTFSTAIQEECARYIVRKNVSLKNLITERWKLDQAAEAYALFDKQSTGKGVFVF